MRKFLIFLIQLYRWTLSPMLGPSCRYYPTCSCYAQEAIARHGALAGAYMGLRRLLRCHPWHPGGYDPVPDVKPAPFRRNSALHG